MSKKSFIDSVEVKKPCDAAWESMTGNEKVRFCDHCAKTVNNISAFRRKDALRLVQASNGTLCIRYIPDPVTRRPMFAEHLVQIARRTPGLAAGVMSASISLSALAYGQTPAQPDIPEPAAIERQVDENQEVKNDTPEEKTGGIIRGMIRDSRGKGVPGVAVYLACESRYNGEETVTGEDGSYKFDGLEPETYVLRVETASGPIRKIGPGIELTAAETIFQDFTVRTHVRHVEPGGEGFSTGDGFGMGGSMASLQYSLPLTRAVSESNVAEVKRLLDAGERANGKDENYDDITPLFIAVENGNVPITRLLLQYGAKVNARSSSKRTPLMFIDSDATAGLIQVLLQAGAKINVHDTNGETPLSIAASSSDVEVVEALIDAGADLNAANDEGVTPLMQAVEAERADTVGALIVAGADINQKDKNGDTAWDKTSDPGIEKALVTAGATVNYDVEVEVVVVDGEADTPVATEPAKPVQRIRSLPREL